MLLCKTRRSSTPKCTGGEKKNQIKLEFLEGRQNPWLGGSRVPALDLECRWHQWHWGGSAVPGLGISSAFQELQLPEPGTPAWMDTQTLQAWKGRGALLCLGLKSIFWPVPVRRISHFMHPGARTKGKKTCHKILYILD